MICPDCEQEFDKLTTKGVCKQCATRINQLNYLNKRDGTNKEYVPLRILKETDPKSYKAAMKRRESKGKQTSSKKKAIITTKEPMITNSATSLRDKYYGIVAKDIEQGFKDAKISQNYLQYKALDSWLETFFMLLQEDNFIVEARQAEHTFNKLHNTYKHSQENASWEDIAKVSELGLAQKALSELRRPTKEMLDFYEAINPIIDYIKQDKTLMTIIEEARILMIQKSKNHEDPKFFAEVDSSLLDKTEVLGINNNRTKIYDCTVWCYNLNGDPNKRLFRANGGIYAKDEVEAKFRFKAFLKDKFASVTYSDKDMSIKEMNTQEEIRKLSIKEGA